MISLDSIKILLGKYVEIIRDNFLHIIVGSFIVLPFIIFFYVSHPHNKIYELNHKQNEIMLNELKDINGQMQIIAKNPSQSKVYEALQSIQNDATTIQKSIVEVAKTADIQKVSNQITGIKEDVDNQINDLKKTVVSSMSNKQFLDPNALPFNVISIDVIAGQPYVSVDYANHILPIAIGDLLAGWRVNSADYDSSVVEFVNGKNQFVSINLKGV
jgi:soluble cytochrome b562